ncbi:MAG: hypothetical protein AB1689_26340, partial [Thermodesulfobacteriota bacterium]
LLPGAGLAGFGPSPDSSTPPDLLDVLHALSAASARPGVGPDPAARSCEGDVRPPDYARAYGGAARRLLLVEDDDARPPWWAALRDLPGARVLRGDSASTLRALAGELTTSETPSGA